MTRKALVKLAIECKGPPQVPLLYFNEHKDRSDILICDYKEALDFPHRGTQKTEWGFDWERVDNTMGQPKNPPLTSWDLWKNFQVPDPDAKGRYEHLGEAVKENKDRYLLGGLNISGFNFTTFIRGFSESMEDLLIEPELMDELFDAVVEFENGVIRNYARWGMDGIAFYDDWGTQNDLMISPTLWRERFKPKYQRQFQAVHDLGMHVYFHSCGYVYDILQDLIEIGVDVINLNQPDLLGVERLGKDFGGKVCFNCPVDHQTVAIRGTSMEIHDYVRRLNQAFGGQHGGFIGYIEEYSCVGMSAKNFQEIVTAFEALRK